MGQDGGNSQDIGPTMQLKPIVPSAAVAVTPGLKNVCANEFTIAGADVSSYQPQIDWVKLKAGGIHFVFIKASEGATVRDRCFEMHWQNAKAAGLIRGAYHFYHPSVDPLVQAKVFSDVIGTLDVGDLPPVMDWEVTDGVPSVGDLLNGKIFLDEVQKLTGRKPIIYSGPYFMQELGATVSLAQYPLWIAHYSEKCPLVPFPWPTWTFWQQSGGATVPGVIGSCDYDLFNGTLTDLYNFISTSHIVG
jgi:lysozyme